MRARRTNKPTNSSTLSGSLHNLLMMEWPMEENGSVGGFVLLLTVEQLFPASSWWGCHTSSASDSSILFILADNCDIVAISATQKYKIVPKVYVTIQVNISLCLGSPKSNAYFKSRGQTHISRWEAQKTESLLYSEIAPNWSLSRLERRRCFNIFDLQKRKTLWNFSKGREAQFVKLCLRWKIFRGPE